MELHTGPGAAPAGLATRVNKSVWTAADIIAAAVRASGRTLTDYQRAFLEDTSPLRAVLKARQTGFSWLFALEALAAAIAGRRLSIFVSLNREEAAGKLEYARDLLDALPDELRVKAVRTGANDLRLENGGRLLSFPCRAPRGRAAANVYLDEAAFYPNSRSVYAGTLPVVSHGGRIVIASTPGPETGAFWDAVRGDMAANYSVHVVPWWRAPWFCTDTGADLETMSTEERVRTFGTPVIRRLFGAMERDAFRQEYELLFAATGDSFVEPGEIEPNLCDAPLAGSWPELAAEGGYTLAGMDVGRMHDATALVVVRREGERYAVRFVWILRNYSFDQQEAFASDALGVGGVARLAVDATGIGSHMSENLVRRFRGRVLPVSFSWENKWEMGERVRRLLQRGELALPRHTALLDAMRAIRKEPTSAGRLRLDAARDATGHADLFWALALALHASGGGATVSATRL